MTEQRLVDVYFQQYMLFICRKLTTETAKYIFSVLRQSPEISLQASRLKIEMRC